VNAGPQNFGLSTFSTVVCPSIDGYQAAAEALMRRLLKRELVSQVPSDDGHSQLEHRNVAQDVGPTTACLLRADTRPDKSPRQQDEHCAHNASDERPG